MTDDSNDAYIVIQGVSKHFGKVRAVESVSLEIRAGEFFSLLGPSGCGKTTLLRLIAGFDSPTRGEIFIDGAPVSQVPAYRRPTNMVFQNYAIFPHLTVNGNVAYGLRKRKLPRPEQERLVEQALAMVKLEGFGGRRSNELSGGQRQRVALARALIMRPKVLLLDEPLGALDKKLREEMQLELRALQRSVGITFIFVTHDQEEALTMSDRIAVMDAGHTVQIATPKALYERPNSMKVAGFIGQMNFLDAQVQSVSDGMAAVRARGLGTIHAVNEFAHAHPGGAITVAIRPEKLHLSRERPNGDSAVQGTIEAAAYLGDRSHYYVRVDGCAKPIAVAAQNVDSALTGDAYGSGHIWLSWSDQSAVLLPPE